MADAKLTALTEVSVPATEDLIYLVDDPSGTPVSAKVSLGRMLGLLPGICQGRLTTETGVPISTSDRTAQSTLYFTPYNGNAVSLYDGTRWRLYSFTERSLALSGLTSGLNYDVFLYDNAGTLTLELTAWTNDTTRATALVHQDGVYVRSGAATRRYLGTIRSTAATTTEDSDAKRFVWNYSNRVERQARGVSVADAYTWSSPGSTWRAVQGGVAEFKREFVIGVSEEKVRAVYGGVIVSNDNAHWAIGLDGITVDYDKCSPSSPPWGANLYSGVETWFEGYLAGYHYLQALESTRGATTLTAYANGQTIASGAAPRRAFLTVEFKG